MLWQKDMPCSRKASSLFSRLHGTMGVRWSWNPVRQMKDESSAAEV